MGVEEAGMSLVLLLGEWEASGDEDDGLGESSAFGRLERSRGTSSRHRKHEDFAHTQ